jgi:phage terminase large subunit-like protein
VNRQQKLEEIALLEEKARRKKYNQLAQYKPYAKQRLFHKLSSECSERALGAGNQLGKTLAGSMEEAFHATGIYPDWWGGKRFTRPTVSWVGGVTGETVRDTTQRLLVGRVQKGESEIGTGSIPRDNIIELAKSSHGAKDALDHVKVRHVTGGVSIIYFKSYASGREKWQGDTIDRVWFDEEPPYDIYSEGRTRTNKGQLGRFTMLTFTPLLGMTDVVNQFYKNPKPAQRLITMGIKDVDHYTEEEKAAIIASYEPWEREARVNGVPILGTGRIFRYEEDKIAEPHISEDQIPDHWALLNALDFGWDHPQVCIQIAWDRDNDVIHVIRGKKARETKPEEMWVMVKHWAKEVPTAWPHDGFQHDKGSGKQLSEQYREAGFDMLWEHATHDEGGNGIEAGLMEMHDRFGSGRLLIDEGLEEFWDEYRLYHRDNGKIVKENDDFISAVRYAIMMKRFAKSRAEMRYVAPEPVFETDMPG